MTLRTKKGKENSGSKTSHERGEGSPRRRGRRSSRNGSSQPKFYKPSSNQCWLARHERGKARRNANGPRAVSPTRLAIPFSVFFSLQLNFHPYFYSLLVKLSGSSNPSAILFDRTVPPFPPPAPPFDTYSEISGTDIR